MLETNNDITRQKQIEQALRESEEQLRDLAEGLESQVRARTRELEQRNREALERAQSSSAANWILARSRQFAQTSAGPTKMLA